MCCSRFWPRDKPSLSSRWLVLNLAFLYLLSSSCSQKSCLHFFKCQTAPENSRPNEIIQVVNERLLQNDFYISSESVTWVFRNGQTGSSFLSSWGTKNGQFNVLARICRSLTKFSNQFFWSGGLAFKMAHGAEMQFLYPASVVVRGYARSSILVILALSVVVKEQNEIKHPDKGFEFVIVMMVIRFLCYETYGL